MKYKYRGISMKMKSIFIAAGLLICGSSILAEPASKNSKKPEDKPVGRFIITGYGDFTYTNFTNNQDDFFATRFVPIFLFKLSQKLHAEAELEVTIDSVTGEGKFELEYADIHYYLSDTTTITGGKFLLPFARFGPELHPSWINRLPTAPSGYAAHGSSSPVAGIMPVMSDFGLLLQQVVPINRKHKVLFDAYLVNGPRSESAAEAAAEDDSSPWRNQKRELNWKTEMAFEAKPGDNNKQKAVGGRLAYTYLPLFEIGASFYRGAWNDRDKRTWQELLIATGADYTPNDRYFKASAIDVAVIGEKWRLRGEYVRTVTDVLQPFPEYSGTPAPAQRASAWYAEASVNLAILGIRYLAPVELVARYSSVTRKNLETRVYDENEPLGKTAFNDRTEEQAVFGINYWLNETGVIKVAYESNKLPYKTDLKVTGKDYDRIIVQFGYGF